MSIKSIAFFDKVQARLGKINPAERFVEHVYKIKVTVNGEVKKTWMLDLKAIKFYEADEEAEVTLTCEDDIMIELGTGKLDPKEAVKDGKLLVDGDVALAAKLIPYIAELN